MKKPLTLAFLFIFLAILIEDVIVAGEGMTAIFIVSDQIVPPGERVFIQVKIKETGIFFSSPISGERVEFLINGVSIGASLSGGDGVASREFIPKKEGIYKVVIRFSGKSRYNAEEREMILACWEKGRSIILIKTDTLMDRDKEAGDLRGPAPGAVEVVEKLFKKYKIILFTFEKDEGLLKRREWLWKHSFPVVPLLYLGSEDIDDEVGSLAGHGWKVRFGVGDNNKEVMAFARARVLPIIIASDESDKKEDLPSAAKRVKDWREIEGIILGSLKGS